MQKPIYQLTFSTTMNDPHFDGQEVYSRLINLGYISEINRSLTDIRKGYYVTHINHFGYIGMGSTKQHIRGYFMFKRFNYDADVEDVDNYKIILVKHKKPNSVEYVKLNPPTEQDKLREYMSCIRFFLSHKAFGLDFYEAIAERSRKNIFMYKRDLLGNEITRWQDHITTFMQLKDLIAYAEHYSKLGKCTYGCKKRSVDMYPKMLSAKHRLESLCNTRLADNVSYGTSNTMAGYLLSQIDKIIINGNYLDARAVIMVMNDYLYNRPLLGKDSLVKAPLNLLDHLPSEYTQKSLEDFRSWFIKTYMDVDLISSFF